MPLPQACSVNNPPPLCCVPLGLPCRAPALGAGEEVPHATLGAEGPAVK